MDPLIDFSMDFVDALIDLQFLGPFEAPLHIARNTHSMRRIEA